jgi:Domain of unknown function (DUF4123)
MNLDTYRRHVLDTLRDARNRRPQSRLFLLYLPGYDDPLALAEQEPPQRTTALVPWGKDFGYEPAHWPRVIELDCRKVAAYLLETDPAIDDPLLEETIARAHQGLSTPAADPDVDEGSAIAICGWLVSPESAQDIARRFAQASQRFHPSTSSKTWLRWHDPRMVRLLWPTLNSAQRLALLGSGLAWVAPEPTGHLVQFDASPDASNETPPKALFMQALQWARVGRFGLINQLVEAWRERAGWPLPRHAMELLHRHVAQGQWWGLRGRDLTAFVFAAIELQDGFERDPRLLTVVGRSLLERGTFRDRLDELPADFWVKYECAKPAARAPTEQHPLGKTK